MEHKRSNSLASAPRTWDKISKLRPRPARTNANSLICTDGMHASRSAQRKWKRNRACQRAPRTTPPTPQPPSGFLARTCARPTATTCVDRMSDEQRPKRSTWSRIDLSHGRAHCFSAISTRQAKGVAALLRTTYHHGRHVLERNDHACQRQENERVVGQKGRVNVHACGASAW